MAKKVKKVKQSEETVVSEVEPLPAVPEVPKVPTGTRRKETLSMKESKALYRELSGKLAKVKRSQCIKILHPQFRITEEFYEKSVDEWVQWCVDTYQDDRAKHTREEQMKMTRAEKREWVESGKQYPKLK